MKRQLEQASWAPTLAPSFLAAKVKKVIEKNHIRLISSKRNEQDGLYRRNTEKHKEHYFCHFEKASEAFLPTFLLLAF